MFRIMDGLRASAQLSGHGPGALLVQLALDRLRDRQPVPSKKSSGNRLFSLGDMSVRNTQHGPLGFAHREPTCGIRCSGHRQLIAGGVLLAGLLAQACRTPFRQRSSASPLGKASKFHAELNSNYMVVS